MQTSKILAIYLFLVTHYWRVCDRGPTLYKRLVWGLRIWHLSEQG